MKRGTAAKVILGKDTLMDVPTGIVHGTDVILGGKAGLLNDFGGLVLSNNLMLGKKVSRGTITTVTVRGQSPLVLPDAIAGSLQAVKAFGGTEQNGTPTPDAPVDIVSNNGVLKARHQSGLPLGYTLLEHIKSTGTQYLDTGINGSQITRFVVKGTCAPKGSSNSQLLGGTSATATTFFGARVITGATNWYCYYGTKSLGNPTLLSIIDCAIESASSQPGTLTDTTTGTTQAFTKLAAGNWGFGSENLLLFGGDATRRSTNATCCYLQLYTSGGLAFSGVPCMRNSDNVVGMYDLVSGQFFTNQGTGDFVAGETVDDIEVYADGIVETIKDSLNNTATAEMLLKVGDYQDVQSIIDGVVTRNIGVKVLDGTENFETATATNCYSLTNTLGTGNFADRTIVCSHFASTPTMPGTGDRQGLAFIVNKGPEYTIAFGATTQFSTQALWTQWLADQYAAGTPVIVLYPLATPTTESVAGQPLQVQAGDNVLEITQASLDGLELEATYKSLVQLTIQEVEDANLNNNVEVTIS